MNSGPKRLDIKLAAGERYVSRAALKLAGAAAKFRLDFKGKIVLDVGSSTGGFTDYSLKHGAQKVIAVEAGTGQLHPSLRGESRVELHEKTDIREFKTDSIPDIVLIDVSFISLRQVLPAVAKLSGQQTQIMAMVKPQFEAGAKDLNKGVIKNDSIRRRILKEFELWVKDYFIIRAKADSEVAGAKGNYERFYLLSLAK
jgi:23S rRNA (cytidine1920-2'-O)/16S rRNA (cytidine1409-2'-O)-methyltransferase